MPGVNLSDYVTVAQRIALFRERHPEGCLRPVNPAEPYTILTVGDKVFVVYSAAAYRTPDDPMPGVGVAWEAFPGKTPYTRDSELMNCFSADTEVLTLGGWVQFGQLTEDPASES